MRPLLRLVAAVALTAAASLAVPLAPASASTCATASGVTVVVDFHELGGGSQAVCDAGGAGRTAAAQFGDAGFDLDRVARQPGFVCRVDSKPASDPCQNTPPADAYWGLWWSDGKLGSWTYASEGVDSLKVPEGGYVALSWNGSSSRSAPGTSPSPHATSSPSPSSHPSSQPPSPHPSPTSGQPSTPTHSSGGPSGGSTSGGTGSSASASPSSGASPAAHHTKHRSASASPSTGRSAAASTAPEPSQTPEGPASDAAAGNPSDPGDSGLPGWVAPAAIGLLFVGAAGTAVVRRRRGTTSP